MTAAANLQMYFGSTRQFTDDGEELTRRTRTVARPHVHRVGLLPAEELRVEVERQRDLGPRPTERRLGRRVAWPSPPTFEFGCVRSSRTAR